MKRTLEVIATSLEDAIAAEAGGADRIEVIAAMEEGGLTPSLQLVEQITGVVKVDVQVMIRPHSRSFTYTDHELARMIADIHSVRAFGRPGIVIGCLTSDGKVDERALSALLAASGDLDVTFHRALDEAADLEQAFRTLLVYGPVRRVLTSGGESSAITGAPFIRKLQLQSHPAVLGVMAGCGLTVEALPAFLMATGVQEIHFGSDVRSIGTDGRSFVDVSKVEQVRRILDQDGLG